MFHAWSFLSSGPGLARKRPHTQVFSLLMVLDHWGNYSEDGNFSDKKKSFLCPEFYQLKKLMMKKEDCSNGNTFLEFPPYALLHHNASAIAINAVTKLFSNLG